MDNRQGTNRQQVKKTQQRKKSQSPPAPPHWVVDDVLYLEDYRDASMFAQALADIRDTPITVRRMKRIPGEPSVFVHNPRDTRNREQPLLQGERYCVIDGNRVVNHGSLENCHGYKSGRHGGVLCFIMEGPNT